MSLLSPIRINDLKKSLSNYLNTLYYELLENYCRCGRETPLVTMYCHLASTSVSIPLQEAVISEGTHASKVFVDLYLINTNTLYLCNYG